MSIREIHGVADAEKVMATHTEKQRVTVIDGDGRLFIELSAAPSAGLTPAQARMIAHELTLAADRIEKVKKSAHLNAVKA